MTRISVLRIASIIGFAAAIALSLPADRAVAQKAKEESPTAIATKLVADFTRAMKAKDFAYFQNGSTSDFTYIDMKGKKTPKALAMGQMKQGLMMMKIQTLQTKLLSAKKAEGGVVYVFETKILAEVEMGGKKPSILKSTSKEEMLSVKQGGKWMTKRVKDLMDDTTLDGKKLNGK